MATLTNGSSSSSTGVTPSALARSQTPPVLPPADRSNKGALIVTVLSAYDLSSDAAPTAVSLKVGTATVRTGPPAARHKDRNSFRFTTNQVLQVNAPLSVLYNSKALLTVEYSDATQNLTAVLVPKKSAHIHETTWLILNLESTSTPENNDAEPTLRLQVRLEGPFRTEWAALVSAANLWFHGVDAAEGAASQVLAKVPSLPSGKLLLIPTVPLVTAVVVLSPVLLGVLIVGMPVFLPALVVVATILGCVGLVGLTIGASTKSGRTQIASMLAPMYHTLLSTPSGQSLVYETGPRPTPVSLARAVLPTDLWGKLAVSLVIDALGSASYLLPLVGEGLDVAWAPLQTILIMAMYDSVAPNLKYLSFMEEILPLTDVVPSATIGWLTEFGPQLLSPKNLTSGGSGGMQMTSAVNRNGAPVLS